MTNYTITARYDEDTIHWSKNYSDELEAHEEFAKFIDWGFANEYATYNLHTPTGKCYTKIFYRNGKVVKR